jgi:hypothetical protein
MICKFQPGLATKLSFAAFFASILGRADGGRIFTTLLGALMLAFIFRDAYRCRKRKSNSQAKEKTSGAERVNE